MNSSNRFAVCLDNAGYEVSLEKRKLYEVVPDTEAFRHGQIRIIDESGEDYLFSLGRFMELPLPEEITRAVAYVR